MNLVDLALDLQHDYRTHSQLPLLHQTSIYSQHGFQIDYLQSSPSCACPAVYDEKACFADVYSAALRMCSSSPSTHCQLPRRREDSVKDQLSYFTTSMFSQWWENSTASTAQSPQWFDANVEEIHVIWKSRRYHWVRHWAKWPSVMSITGLTKVG